MATCRALGAANSTLHTLMSTQGAKLDSLSGKAL